MGLLTEIVRILVSAITEFGSGLGTGIQSVIQSMFVNIDATTGTQTLTVMGIVVCSFAGISLCVGITKRIFNWLITLGGRK